MKLKTDPKKDVGISISHCRRWSSSAVRNMCEAGTLASTAAVDKAAKTGVAVSYIEDGVLKVKSASGTVTRIKELKATP